MVKEYMNANGYRIKASEKAYRLLYKKNGFVPVEGVAPGERTATMETGMVAQTGDTTPTEDAAPAGDMTASAKTQLGKTGKGKTKSTASKTKKTVASDTAADQESYENTSEYITDQDSPEEGYTGTALTDSGTAEHPEVK